MTVTFRVVAGMLLSAWFIACFETAILLNLRSWYGAGILGVLDVLAIYTLLWAIDQGGKP